MHDPDQRDELTAIVLDEKNILIADLEFRRVAYAHCFAVHRAAEHPNGVTLAGISLESIRNLERDIAHDVTLSPLTDPF